MLHCASILTSFTVKWPWANHFNLSSKSLQIESWKVGTEACHTKRLNRLVGEKQSVVGQELGSKEAMAERRMLYIVNTILDDPSHLSYKELWQSGSQFSHMLIPSDWVL